jgi:hypothetical protein
VEGAVGTTIEDDPQIVVIEKALPAVCDRLHTITGVVQTGFEGSESQLQQLGKRMLALENVVGDFCTGAFNLTFTPGSQKGLQPLCSFPSFAAATAAPLSPMLTSPSIRIVEQPPTYQLSRGITTIPDLWREWRVGLGGQLSVEALDERWGSRWRCSNAEP